jgi:arylformamidase
MKSAREAAMIHHRIADWDDAYANGPHIAGAEAWPERCAQAARAFRDGLGAAGRARLDLTYGGGPRNRFDLFMPVPEPKGLVVFFHGGYFMRFDKSFWSHLAEGAIASGFAVAMPSYTLCPEIKVAGIVAEAGAAVEAAAALVQGGIHLAGHSAGGHLATRMIAVPSPLPASVLGRIRNTVSISGLHDLRPLMRTAMNATLGLDAAEAATESPALLAPVEGVRLTAWVGGAERSEFIRQSALIANVWLGLGAATALVEEPDRHHFSIVDGLQDRSHGLTRTLLAD